MAGSVRRLRGIVIRLFGLVRRADSERELTQELESHLQLHIDDYVSAGMTPAEARRQAVLALGGVDQTKERYRDQRGVPFVEHFVQDLRFAARGLGKNPGFASVAILTLVIGIGANVTVFSLASALLFKPLDIAHPGSAVHVFSWRSSNTPYSDYERYRDGNSTLSSLGAFRFVALGLRGPEASELVPGAIVSGNYFSTVGVRPVLGRLIDERDDELGAAGSVALSNRSWRLRFRADPTIVGRPVTINGHPFTVVGVLPPEFRGEMLPFAPELWIAWHAPSHAGARGERSGAFGSARLTGRRAAGRNIAEVQADLTRLANVIALEHPDTRANLSVSVVPATVLPPEFGNEVGFFLTLLMSLVAIVLIVGCLNLANLLTARWSARRGEIALRLALGAGRGRIVRQLMTESLLLSACGGGGAALVATWAMRLASGTDFATPIGPMAVRLAFDWRVATFSFVASCAATVMFGLLPAIQVSRTDLQPELKDAGHTASAMRSRTRATLMVVQLALSTVLLVASGLLVRSMEVARSADRGFVADGVLAASMDVSTLGYDETQGLATYHKILERIEALPGIRAANLVDIVPLTLSNRAGRILKEGESLPSAGEARDNTYLNGVTRGHFATLGIALVAGRDFTDRDSVSSPAVGIVNQTMAARSWPGENPIGKRVRGVRTRDSFGPWIEVVGVVRDSKYATVGEDPRQFLYRPLSQAYAPAATILLRTDGDPSRVVASVRGAVASVVPDLPLFNVGPLNDLTELSLLPLQLATYLSAVLGATALTLAVIGLYGVMSFLVRLRRREIGIRIALGAAPADVVRLVTHQGVRWIAIGLSVGLAVSVAFAQLLAGLLYGVAPADPLVLSGAAVVLGATAYLSCRVPAQRTCRLNPMTVLRDQ
jgi:predicted permease